jgi:hypothetical protein
VLGPNQRQVYNEKKNEWEPDPSDVCFPVRRALLMRIMLGISEDTYLHADRGLLSAFIEIEKYRHGSRSMSRILEQLKKPHQAYIRRSDLPSLEILSLHVDHEKFMNIVNRDLQFKMQAEDLAPYVHEYYRQLGKKEKWITKELDMDYEDLTEAIKEDNRAAAIRIPQVLDLVGLYVVPADFKRTDPEDEIQAVIRQNIELLAEAEHNGWTEHKYQNGWRFGPKRNNDKKIHNCLKPYTELSGKDRIKDRTSVISYIKILKNANYKIVANLDLD